MTPNHVVYSVSCVVALSGLVGSGLLTVPIDRFREQLGPTFNQPLDRAAPPWVTLPTAALGVFRGLTVDVLWYRASKMQEQGKYFEANQLAHWITTLQPRFPQVWSYQAWNMAYNISVATHTPEERWHWVNKGVALLRDKGVVYNPRAIRLYRELGWIYFHKFGRFMDDMHWYYRQELAKQWQMLLGEPPAGGTTQQVIDWFRAIVHAPESLDRLVQQVPRVAMLLNRFEALGYRPGQELLEQIGRVQMYGSLADAVDGAFLIEKAVNPAVADILADPQLAQAVEPFLAYLRQRVLRDDYHMDERFMLELMERYGPLDWRHPVSHGCYWSERGVEVAAGIQSGRTHRGRIRLTEIDLLNTNRQTIHAMQELTRFGRLSLDPISERIDLQPDPRFIPAYERAVELAKRRIDSGAFGDVGKESFDLGHENFLLEAMTIAYLYGDTDQAEHYFKRARDLYADKPHNTSGGRYSQTVAQFVMDQLRHHMGTLSNTSQFIRAMLGRAFDSGLAYNQPIVFERFVTLAQAAYAQYHQDKVDQPTTSQGRLKLLPFDQVLEETYLLYMQSSDISLFKRSRVWANTPVALRQRVGDRLLPLLWSSATQSGFVPERMFPHPPKGSQPSGQQEAAPGRDGMPEVPVELERQ